jgi:NAD(P)-dependent dehydrogenase (short-subunit alcohol dehydrogenase family)
MSTPLPSPAATATSARLRDRVALVTGAASGLGAATSRAIAAAGGSVVCADLDGDGAAAVAGEIGDRALGLPVDVSDEASVQRAVDATVERFGTVDVLFANAGMTYTKPTLEYSLEEFQRVVTVNLAGVWLCARAVLPHMLEAGRGSIVATASTAALRGSGSSAYAASKGGVTAMIRQLAVEFGGTGVRFNAICPGPTRTAMYDGALRLRRPDDFEQALREKGAELPAGRLGVPEDIAALVVFLASDESAFITGTVTPIDGGATAK